MLEWFRKNMLPLAGGIIILAGVPLWMEARFEANTENRAEAIRRAGDERAAMERRILDHMDAMESRIREEQTAATVGVLRELNDIARGLGSAEHAYVRDMLLEAYSRSSE